MYVDRGKDLPLGSACRGGFSVQDISATIIGGFVRFSAAPSATIGALCASHTECLVVFETSTNLLPQPASVSMFSLIWLHRHIAEADADTDEGNNDNDPNKLYNKFGVFAARKTDPQELATPHKTHTIRPGEATLRCPICPNRAPRAALLGARIRPHPKRGRRQQARLGCAVTHGALYLRLACRRVLEGACPPIHKGLVECLPPTVLRLTGILDQGFNSLSSKKTLQGSLRRD
jgi:hypothetical protein